MRRAVWVVVVAVAGSLTAGCYVYDPLWCKTSADCEDLPTRPYCDTTGEHEPNGIANTCVPDPGETPPPGTLSITVPDGPHYLQREGSLEIDLQVTREQVDAPVRITVSNLPDGVSAQPLNIPSSMVTGKLLLTATRSAVVGVTSLSLHATAGTTIADDRDLPLEIIGVPGELDTTFGTEGTGIVTFPDLPDGAAGLVKVLPQGDQAILVLPGPLITRVRADGSLDRSFGADGRAQVAVDAIGISAVNRYEVIIDSAGRIVLVGSGPVASGGSDTDLFMVRFTADGQLDPALPPLRLDSHDGQQTIYALRAAPGGRVFVLGDDAPAMGSSITMVRRFNEAGRLDWPFGRQELPDISAYVGVAQRDGRIVLNRNGRMIRRKVDGEADPSFGNGGETVLPIDKGRAAWKLAESLPNGDMIVAGDADRTRRVLWRLHGNGTVDTTFGNLGYQDIETPDSQSLERAIAIWASGGLIYGIDNIIDYHTGGMKVRIFRLTEAGEQDLTFGENGVSLDPDPFKNFASAAVLERHRVLAAGSGRNQKGVMLRRYWY